MKVAILILSILFEGAQAFPLMPTSSQRQSGGISSERKHVGTLHMTLRSVYDELCQSVSQKLALKVTDFASTYQAQSWRAPTAEGSADWLAESSPQFLTGVSTCTRLNNDGPKREELTLNVWMGPSYDVPHCLMEFGQAADGSYHVTLDYVPRGATVLGGDPQYLQQYYGPDVVGSWTSAYASGISVPPELEFESRLLDSPARLSVTGLQPQLAGELARAHVMRFLSWLDAAQPIPARLRGSFNMRDDKLRQFYYRGQVQKQVRLLGDGIGQTVAVVNTGPTAEAYVGGGS